MTESISLRVHLLGTFRVLVDGRPVPEAAWRSRRAASLVKLLALAPGHRLHREQAMETLWPDLDLDAQGYNLNVAATRARQALASVGAPSGRFVVRLGDNLVLGPTEMVWVDVDAFEETIATAWQGDDPAAFRAALSHFAGDLLGNDPYEDWAENRQSALHASFLAAQSRLGRLHAERGETGYAVEAYQRLVAAEPAHEEAAVALMRLFANQGQRTLALAQFDRLAESLRRDLDTPPLAIDLAAAAAWVREDATLHLSPPEQTKLDSLRETVTSRIGADAVASAWARRRELDVDDLLQAVREQISRAANDPGHSAFARAG